MPDYSYETPRYNMTCQGVSLINNGQNHHSTSNPIEYNDYRNNYKIFCEENEMPLDLSMKRADIILGTYPNLPHSNSTITTHSLYYPKYSEKLSSTGFRTPINNYLLDSILSPIDTNDIVHLPKSYLNSNYSNKDEEIIPSANEEDVHKLFIQRNHGSEELETIKPRLRYTDIKLPLHQGPFMGKNGPGGGMLLHSNQGIPLPPSPYYYYSEEGSLLLSSLFSPLSVPPPSNKPVSPPGNKNPNQDPNYQNFSCHKDHGSRESMYTRKEDVTGDNDKNQYSEISQSR
ncbi:unnamed protein product [Gordionus sp. m RMFG-2023]